jgi:hypothetical protein
MAIHYFINNKILLKEGSPYLTNLTDILLGYVWPGNRGTLEDALSALRENFDCPKSTEFRIISRS